MYHKQYKQLMNNIVMHCNFSIRYDVAEIKCPALKTNKKLLK